MKLDPSISAEIEHLCRLACTVTTDLRERIGIQNFSSVWRELHDNFNWHYIYSNTGEGSIYTRVKILTRVRELNCYRENLDYFLSKDELLLYIHGHINVRCVPVMKMFDDKYMYSPISYQDHRVSDGLYYIEFEKQKFAKYKIKMVEAVRKRSGDVGKTLEPHYFFII